MTGSLRRVAGCLFQPASFAVSFTAHKVFPAVVTKPLLRLNLKSHRLLNWSQWSSDQWFQKVTTMYRPSDTALAFVRTFCRSIDVNVHHHFHLTYDGHCRCVVRLCCELFCRGLTTTTGVIQLVMFCFTGLARQMDGFLMSHIFTFYPCTFNCTPFLDKV